MAWKYEDYRIVEELGEFLRVQGGRGNYQLEGIKGTEGVKGIKVTEGTIYRQYRIRFSLSI